MQSHLKWTFEGLWTTLLTFSICSGYICQYYYIYISLILLIDLFFFLKQFNDLYMQKYQQTKSKSDNSSYLNVNRALNNKYINILISDLLCLDLIVHTINANVVFLVALNIGVMLHNIYRYFIRVRNILQIVHVTLGNHITRLCDYA